MGPHDASQGTVREHTRLLHVARSAARAAAAIIRERAPSVSHIVWQVKRPMDFVSEVDTAAEHAIRDVIAREEPSATVLGEELSPEAGIAHGVAFVVDPLDGTTNFLHGYPEYAVSVAALLDAEPAAAVVVNVPADEWFTAVAGGGAFRNGERVHVSAIADPARALIGTGFPFKQHELLPRYLRQFDAVMRTTAGIRRAGSAALDLCDVASGRFDAFWELVLSPWDFAAGTMIVREAGGVVTDAAGDALPVATSSVLAGNPTMHAWLRDTLRDAARGEER
ncbi:MAG TPA: inositol monophosphatase family protein [Gemmatimonadaceae bacterium]|nr:inositol monophosphatase family protein [Gemmatimonadaceae bacterium]